MGTSEDYCVLDEAVDFYEKYVVTSRVNTDFAVLAAATTYAMPALVTTFRVLWTSKKPGQELTGKTTAMNVTAALSANPEEANGSYASLRSALMAVSNTPENPLHTWVFDAIDNALGEDGQGTGGNQTLIQLLEKGYKKGAHDSVSVRGTKKEIPLFYPVFCTGKGVSLRRDIRTRTVVVRMDTAKPARYFSVREGEPEARELGEAIGREVKLHLAEIEEFRGLGIHPKLVARKLEVWEGLFAVAKALGGQRWLNKCRDCFETLALDSGMQALSPKQRTLRDAVLALDLIKTRIIPNGKHVGAEFAGGLALADEISRMEGWEEKSALAVARAVADHMSPVSPWQQRFGKEVLSGYLAEDIRKAWAAVRPEDADDVLIPEEINPFDVTMEYELMS